VFRSYYVDGSDYLEIAHVTGLPPLHVSQLLATARDTLQTKYQLPTSEPTVLKGLVRIIGLKGLLAVL
jgi:DNA-directed RNA polymerase specialized sigma24 family protein